MGKVTFFKSWVGKVILDQTTGRFTVITPNNDDNNNNNNNNKRQSKLI